MMIREAPLRIDPDRNGEDKNTKLGDGNFPKFLLTYGE
jgi:hypothetical protein